MCYLEYPSYWRIHYLIEETGKYRNDYIAVWFTIIEFLDSKKVPNMIEFEELELEKANKTNWFAHVKKENREMGW